MKILLADDSMTAQNMGKKILTDAGYEVIAVSNGAMAMKKIASEKPDLLILDQFMPGYTGSEICLKVKETGKTPVIIAVGKMEPFKPEEAAKVGADAVIVKPFEPTDLIAIVQKFSPKAGGKKEQFDRTLRLERPVVQEFKDESYEQWKTEAPPHDEEKKPLEMTAEQGATSAFDEPAYDSPAPAAAAAAPAPAEWSTAPSAQSPWASQPVTSALEATSPEPPAWSQPSAVVESPSFDIAAPVEEASAAPAANPFESPTDFSVPAPPYDAPPVAPLEETAELSSAPSLDAAPAGFQPKASDAAQLESTPQPDFSPVAASAPPEFEPTSAPPVEVAVSTPAGFEPTAAAAVEAHIAPDPALATDRTAMASEFATQFTAAGESVPVGIAPHMETEVIEAVTQPAAAPEPVVEPEPQFGADTSSSPFEVTPEPEPEPPSTAAADLEFAAALNAAISTAPVAPPEPDVPAIAASAATTNDGPAALDNELVTRAVDRVLNRMKAEVIAEIMREMKK